MERLEIYSPSRCKNPSCVGRQTTLSQGTRYRAENTNLSPWYRVAPIQYLFEKGSYGYGETRNVFL